jgi:DNA-binding PadR family transcriptional regulator
MFNDQTKYNSRDFRSPHFWMGRHHGGHGSGHFAGGFGGFGGFGRGGAGFRTGRKLGGPDLQLLILALLAENPSHGYELIKALEDRSGGFYVPSPGMIYPALTYLEEISYATVEAEGARKLYAITDAGRRYLEENRSTVDTMLEELVRVGGRMEHVRRAFNGEEPRDDDFAGETRDLHAARRALKMALHEKHHCPPEEAKRIADILRRAASEITGKS